MAVEARTTRTRQRPYRLSAAQYEQMADSGILGEDDPVELIDGLLVRKLTKGDPHILATKLAFGCLQRALPAGWHATKEDPILLRIAGRDSQPEPDVALLRGSPRDYRGRKPEPGDIGLIVEVADTSYAVDRNDRWLRYAAGIPVFWLLDLRNRRLEVFTAPTPTGYTTTVTYDEAGLVPMTLDGVEVARIAVADLLP